MIGRKVLAPATFYRMTHSRWTVFPTDETAAASLRGRGSTSLLLQAVTRMTGTCWIKISGYFLVGKVSIGKLLRCPLPIL